MAAKPKPKRSRSTTRKSARERRTGFPDRIFALASPRSVGGVSMFEPGALADATTVGNFVSESDLVSRAVNLLSDAGFEVLQATELLINIAGPRDLYEKAFGTSLVTEERPVVKELGTEDTATFIDSTDTDVPGLIATTGTRFEETL